MTKKRSTRRALALSLISLLLCVSMFVGTTFAWFTDSVSSTNNIIKSGNLDIELEYWDGTAWVDVSGKADVLTNTLFEPGVVEIAYLRVANAGSLALKYQLGINIVSETAGVNKDGNPFLLSDYIQFGVVEGVNGETNAYANREDAVDAVAEAKKISAGYTKADSMASGDELYLALVVYMPTTVDNVANHNGVTVPQIDLGINVLATQLASEEDSFDKYYDGAAKWLGGVDVSWYNDTDTEFVIGSAEQLAGLAQIVNTDVDSFAGNTIKLASDINLNNLAWTPVGNWDNTFEGTFDGQGHTIYNLYINDAEGEGVGFFGVVQNATIKGVTIENVDISAYSMVAGLIGAAYPASISDCHVTGDVEIVAEWAYVAGIAGYCYYGTQVDGCSVIAADTGLIQSVTRNAVGGITAWLLEGNHNVTNCDVKNLNLIGWTNVGGITGFVHYNNTIDNCSVKNVNLIKTRADGCPGIGLIAGGYSYSAANAITLTNNTVDNVSMSGTHIAYSPYNELYGSEYGGITSANFVLVDNTVSGVSNNLVEVVKATPATVQDMIDNAASGDAILLSAGKYHTTINMKSNVTLVGEAGTVVDCINLNGAANITLKNIEFDAAGAKYGYNGNGGAIQPANIISRTNGSDVQGAANIVIDGCTFGGTFADGGVAIGFTDQGNTGYSNITIKGCTFKAIGGYTDIYTYYSGNNGYFNIENNIFASTYYMETPTMLPIYLGKYQSATPVVVKGNTFEKYDSINKVVYLQDHGSYGVSYNAADNVFNG